MSGFLSFDSPAAAEILAPITHVYTDLDGTLLAPGGKLLANHQGKPSFSLAKSLVLLASAEVEVIIVTGRDAVSSTEIMRLLGLERFIAEMGCVAQTGYGGWAQKRFLLGEWGAEHFGQDYNKRSGLTPREMIARSGALAHVLRHFKGKLEEHTLKGSAREVSYLLRGNVDTSPQGELAGILASYDLPLQLLDNGVIHPQNHGLLAVDEIHVYHLMPRGSGKGEAVRLDMQEHGLAPEQTIALGDAAGDVAMGCFTGSFVLANSGKDKAFDSAVRAAVARPEHLFKTAHRTASGWTEFAQALLAAKGR